MGSSKNKSSFRIADILHQQSGGDSTNVMHQLWKSSAHNSNRNNNNNETDKVETEVPDSSESKKTSSSPAALEMPQNENNIPFKPTPIAYSNFLELQKANFTFPLGLSAFHPAYLNYADALHKVSSSRMFPFYHPYAGYFLPSYNSKRKGGQVRFTPQQTQNLERRFNTHKYLSPEDRRKLAIELSLSDRQVKTWFQNRRAKWRRSNNSSGTSVNHPHINSSNNNNLEMADDLSNSSVSSEGEQLKSHLPLNMYLHHHPSTVTGDSSDEENDLEVN